MKDEGKSGSIVSCDACGTAVRLRGGGRHQKIDVALLRSAPIEGRAWARRSDCRYWHSYLIGETVSVEPG
jgi:hypothetical protein